MIKKKRLKRFLSWLVVFCLLFSVTAMAVPVEVPTGTGSTGGTSMPSGGSFNVTAGTVSTNAAICIENGEVSVSDDVVDTYEVAEGGVVSGSEISGVYIADSSVVNQNTEATGYGPTAIAILNTNVTLGGDTGYYSVTKDDSGTPVVQAGDDYNSVIILDNEEDVFDRQVSELTNGVAVATGGDEGDGTVLKVDNVYMWVDGWKRTTVFSDYPSGARNSGTGPNVVVTDSYLEASGNDNYKYGWQALYGGARATLLQGSDCWFYNSTVVAEGWGPLSIDGSSLTMYAVNTTAETTGGGYITYSPGGGWAKFYGLEALSAQYGMFLTGNGSGVIGSLSDAVGTDAEKYMSISDISEADYVTEDGGSYIEADYAAVIVHQGGTSSVAQLYASNSTLTTENPTYTMHEDSHFLNDDYNGATWFWVSEWKGSTMVTRSSSPSLNLDNVTLGSSTGVLFTSVVNWENTGKKDSFTVSDGKQAASILLNMSNMTADGDILHEDFYRPMELNLANTTLSGAVVSGTKAAWNDQFSAAAIQSGAAWMEALDTIAGWSTTDPDDVFDYDPNFTLDADTISANLCYDTEYSDVWGVRMTMDASSAWTVTENSSLYSLSIADGAKITAPAGYTLSIYVDCDIDTNDTFYDYTTGTRVAALDAGVTYQGLVITVNPISFTDVTPGNAYYADVFAAVRLGLVNGNGDGTFGPEKTVTVMQAIKLAACAHQLDTTGAITLTNSPSGPWYSSYVSYCEANGIVIADYDDYNVEIAKGQLYDLLASALPGDAAALRGLTGGTGSIMRHELCSLLVSLLGEPAQTTSTLLKNALLLDANYLYEKQDVLIVDGQIAAIGSNLGDADQVIDLDGYTLMPGFIDAHIHIAVSDDGFPTNTIEAWAYNGVTTVRELGMLCTLSQADYAEWIVQQNQRADTAHILATGKYIDVDGGYGAGPVPAVVFGNIVTTADEAANAVNEAAELGFSGIKIGINSETHRLSGDMITAICQRANSFGLHVAAHISTAAQLEELISYGVTEAAHTPDDSMSDSLIAKLVSLGVSMDTTLGEPDSAGDNDVKLDNLKRFYDAGGTIVVGTDLIHVTDALAECKIPVAELRQLFEAGLPLQQVIQAATLNAATVMGTSDAEGSIEVGKQANLVAVKGQLDESFDALNDVDFVMHYGTIIRQDA